MQRLSEMLGGLHEPPSAVAVRVKADAVAGVPSVLPLDGFTPGCYCPHSLPASEATCERERNPTTSVQFGLPLPKDHNRLLQFPESLLDIFGDSGFTMAITTDAFNAIHWNGVILQTHRTPQEHLPCVVPPAVPL